MSTANIRQKTDQNIRKKTAPNSIKKEYHAEINDLLCDELDAQLKQIVAGVIGTVTPTDAPTGNEQTGQSYRVSNSTSGEVTYTNFLDNTDAAVKVPAKSSGYLTKNADGWVFVKDNLNTDNLATKDEAVLSDDLELAGVNLFDSATFTDDKYVNSSGLIVTQPGYRVANIALDNTQTKITIDRLNLVSIPVSKYYVFDSDPISFGRFNGMPSTLNIPTGASNLTFTALEIGEPESTLSDIVIQYGTEIGEYGIIRVKGKTLYNAGYTKTDANARFATIAALKPYFDNILIEQSGTTNLLNPDTRSVNCYLNTVNGGLTVYANYDTSDFIPVKRNTLYTVLNLDQQGVGYRFLAFYDANKVFKTAIESIGLSKTFTSLDEDGYFVKLSVPNKANPSYPSTPENIGLFEGASPIWQSFNNFRVKLKGDTQTADKADNEIATIEDIKNIVDEQGAPAGQDTVNYALTTTGTLTIGYPEGTLSALVRNQRGNTGNNMLNFSSYALKGQGSNPTDDAAPTHEQNTTIGANHGVVVAQFTATAHGLTNADKGSAWTKGVYTYYLMLVVNVNTLLFLGENIGTTESPSFAPLSSGDYTRVPDGTVLTLSNYTSAQLYPAIKNLISKVRVNGTAEIEDAGQGVANFIDVVESYDIKLTASILQNVIDNPGASDLTFAGDTSTAIRNIYRFLPNMATLVISEYRKIAPTVFADWMVTQSNCTIGGIAETYYYIPHSNPLNLSVDLRKPAIVPWSASLPSTFVINDSQPDPNNPPNRVIMYNNNLGYMIGYLPKYGVAKALNSFTHATFELRNNTGKVYPHAVDSVRTSGVLPADATFNVIMMRVYTDLTKTRFGNRLSYFNFSYEGVEYVFIDYSGSMYDRINLEKTILNGKAIEVVENINTQILTDVYNGGLTIKADYVEGETCYAVLIIK